MTFHEIARIIGTDTALKLIGRLGGVGIYVPHRPRHGSGELVAAIGLEAARKLAREMGGERIQLPKSRAKMRGEILTAVADGRLSKRRAALMLDLTERQIYNLTPARQAGLFDKS